MKTECIKLNRLIPVLGIALAVVGTIAAAIYTDLERMNGSSQASMATLSRLTHEQQLSAVLKRLHDGDVEAAARSLDLLLCGDILLSNAELPSTDAETRALVQDTFRRIALARPHTELAAGPLARKPANGKDAAERILYRALAAQHDTAMK
jgi:hypothetical protein